MKRRRIIIAVLVVFAVALIVINIITPEPKRWDVRIVTPPAIIASLPHWVAEERGFYSDAHLTVKTINITASNLMIQALVEGSADVLPAVSLVDVINGSAKTTNRPLIYSHSRMPTDPPFEAIIVMTGSKIATLRDLEGKVIAVYPGITSKTAVEAFLDANDVDVSQIEFIPLPPPDHLSALQRGDVSASHIYDPHRAAVLRGGQTRMISGSIYSYMNRESAIGVSVISAYFLRDNREAAQLYLEVWDRAVDFIRENEKEAREILQRQLKMLPEVAALATWVNVTKIQETSQKKVKETAATFQELGVIEPGVAVDDSFFFDSDAQN